jgi:antitoxin HigA-1
MPIFIDWHYLAGTLALQIKVPPNRISEILRARRSITGDTALRLGHWFQTSAEFWLNLQTAYDLRVAGLKAGEEIDALPVRPKANPDHLRS